MASGLENIETIESPFRRFVTTIGVFPTAFTDAMTYYECLAYLVKYLEETVIPAVNENAEAVEELQRLYIQLKTFVDTYFENLDVQEEINNKLDAMVEAGTLQEIITTYIQANVAWCFDTVADMKAATNLVAGSYAQTLGYHSIDDNGKALYLIRTKSESDTIDGGKLISLNDETLVAELIIDNKEVTPEQFGAYGDGEHNDTTALQNALNSGNTVKCVNHYLIDSTVSVYDSLIMDDKSFIKFDSSVTGVGVSVAHGQGQMKNKTYTINVDAQGYSETAIAFGQPKKCKCKLYVINAGTTAIDTNYYSDAGNNENVFECDVIGNVNGTTVNGVKVDCKDSYFTHIITQDCLNGVLLDHGELICTTVHCWLQSATLNTMWENSCTIKSTGNYNIYIDWLYQDTMRYGIYTTNGISGYVRFFEFNTLNATTSMAEYKNINVTGGVVMLEIKDFNNTFSPKVMLTYNIQTYKNNVFAITGRNASSPIYQESDYTETFSNCNYAPQIGNKFVVSTTGNLPVTEDGVLDCYVIGDMAVQKFIPKTAATATPNPKTYYERYRIIGTTGWTGWTAFNPYSPS